MKTSTPRHRDYGTPLHGVPSCASSPRDAEWSPQDLRVWFYKSLQPVLAHISLPSYSVFKAQASCKDEHLIHHFYGIMLMGKLITDPQRVGALLPSSQRSVPQQERVSPRVNVTGALQLSQGG